MTKRVTSEVPCRHPDCPNAKRHGRGYRYCDDHQRTNLEATQEAQAAKRAAIQAIKVERGCADCGWNENPVALDFDHRDGETKLLNIGQAVSRVSLDRLLAEIAKCDVVCARCHRIRSHERGQHIVMRKVQA